MDILKYLPNCSQLILGAIAGFIIKTILNFNFAHKLVKHLSWSIFLNDMEDLRGEWRSYWEVNSKNFPNEENRYGTAKMWQLGKYCYAEFITNEKQYVLFGDMRGSYLVGHWYDAKDKMGYLGVFELRIVDGKNLLGRWLGHSKVRNEINTDEWVWKKAAN